MSEEVSWKVSDTDTRSVNRLMLKGETILNLDLNEGWEIGQVKYDYDSPDVLKITLIKKRMF